MADKRTIAHAVTRTQDQPWDRMKGEPSKAFDCFCMYRDMPPGERSVRELAKRLGKRSTRRMEQWSSKWKWADRVKAWEAHIDKLHRETQEDDLAKRRKDWQECARLMQAIGMTDLKTMRALQVRQHNLAQEERKFTPDALPEPLLKPNEAKAFLEKGMAFERLILGEPSEIQVEQSGLDMSKLSAEDLKELKRIRDKAGSK